MSRSDEKIQCLPPLSASADADVKKIPRVAPLRELLLEKALSIRNEHCVFLELLNKITDEKIYRTIWETFGKEILQHLLQLVVEGNQDEVEKRVKIRPALIFCRESVKDNSGRLFENLSAWEYVLWAWDRHMWTMLLKYIGEDQMPIALAQLKNLEDKGLTYTIQKKTINLDTKEEEVSEKTVTESHYDFSPLIQVLQTFVDNYERWKKCLSYWCTLIGGQQQMVPAHITHEYCRQDRSFDPTPAFDEKDLPRCSKFYSYPNASFTTWFPVDSQIPRGLGVNFAVVRGGSRGAIGAGIGGAYHTFQAYPVRADLAAMIALSKTRRGDLAQLKKQLYAVSVGNDSSFCLVM